MNRSRGHAGIRAVIGPVVALVATVVLVAATWLIPAGRPPAPVTVSPLDTQSTVCALGDGAGSRTLKAATQAGPLQFGPLDGALASHPSPVSASVKTSQRLTGPVPTAGGIYAVDGPRLDWTACQSASSVLVVQVADPATATLVLVNPDARAVSVDLTLSNDTGDITSAGARGIPVGGNSTSLVPLSQLAPAGHPLGVVVRTDQGRVAAMVESSSPSVGFTVSNPAATGTALVVPGIPAGAASVRLILTNSGSQRATANVQALVTTGPFTPQGGDSVTLDPGVTIVLDLTKPLTGQAASFSVAADLPVAATAMVTTARDAALIPATLAAADQLVVAPAAGVLQISNPQTTPVTVEVTTPSGPQSVTITEGATWTVPVSEGGVSVHGSGPVVAAVVVGGKTGIAVTNGVARGGSQSPVPVYPDPRLR